MSIDAGEREARSAKAFLALLGSAGHKAIDCSRVMAVFAHPDDETIAIGGQFRRLKGIRLLHVTDGAPANMRDARAYGFSRREDYAEARRRELAAALDGAGVPPDALLTLGAVDQAAAPSMAMLAEMLAAAFTTHMTDVVITHAYEGGHPDHDATAFAVHAACRLLEGRGKPAPDIVECPLYHARDGGWVLQRFTALPVCNAFEVTVALDNDAANSKREMLSTHATQQRTLAPFECTRECFRRAPRYDFSELPNGGELLYEQFDWGLDGKAWLRLAQEARSELGLPRWF